MENERGKCLKDRYFLCLAQLGNCHAGKYLVKGRKHRMKIKVCIFWKRSFRILNCATICRCTLLHPTLPAPPKNKIHFAVFPLVCFKDFPFNVFFFCFCFIPQMYLSFQQHSPQENKIKQNKTFFYFQFKYNFHIRICVIFGLYFPTIDIKC